MLPDEDWTLPDWEDTGGYPPGYEEPVKPEEVVLAELTELGSEWGAECYLLYYGHELDAQVAAAVAEQGFAAGAPSDVIEEESARVRAEARRVALEYLDDHETFPSLNEVSERMFPRHLVTASSSQPPRRHRVFVAHGRRARERRPGGRRRSTAARRAAGARSGSDPGDDGPGEPPRAALVRQSQRPGR